MSAIREPLEASAAEGYEMARIRDHRCRDASMRYVVEWRHGGSRTNRTATEPFHDKRSL